jgi:hypothetical protein
LSLASITLFLPSQLKANTPKLKVNTLKLKINILKLKVNSLIIKKSKKSCILKLILINTLNLLVFI